MPSGLSVTPVPDAELRGMALDGTLILMACSATKRPVQPGALLPLIDLYNGPMWQTLRTRLQGRRAHVVVLSGRYGITSAHATLPTYEAKLTAHKADALIAGGLYGRQDWFGELRKGAAQSPYVAMKPRPDPRRLAPACPWGGVVVAAGGEYRRVFLAMVEQLRAAGEIAPGAPVLMTHGGIGEQRSQLGRWISVIAGNAAADLGIAS